MIHLYLLKCLLQYRVTPISDLDASPSQLLMSRLLRTALPVHTSNLIPFVVPDVKFKLQSKQDKLKENYDKSAVRKDISFNVSEKVFVQNPITKHWETGLVLEICDEPRSYIVQTNSSKVRRNVKCLKPNHTQSDVSFSMLPSYVLYHATPSSTNVPDIPIVQNNENIHPQQPRRSARLQSKLL